MSLRFAPPTSLGHTCEKLRPLLIQDTQVLSLSPRHKFTDLCWYLTPVVQRSGVCTGGARLPSGSRVGTHTDTGDRTVHTERCTRDQGPAHKAESQCPGANVPFFSLLIDPVQVPRSA